MPSLLAQSENAERAATTNEQGSYVFPPLRIGSYEVRAEQPGFRPAVSAVPQLRVAVSTSDVATRRRGQRGTVQDVVTRQLETETSRAARL